MNLEHPQTRRWLVIVCIASAVVLAVAGGALWYLTRTPAPQAVTPTPLPISLTPPASLDEIADRYPEVAELLRDPALASAYKEFLVAYQQGGLAAAETLARERGLLSKHGEVRITLVLDSAASAPAVNAELEKLGITVEGTYKDMVDIAVPLTLIDQASKKDDPGQVFAQLSGMEHVVKLRLPVPNRADSSLLPSEGVTTTGALAWHTAGYTGRGVKIGVIDLGFDGYQNLLGKTLPNKVTVKSFVPGQEVDEAGEVHGTACAEIVHAMAPDAQLYLAYYNGSVTGLGRAAEWMVEQDVQIISHSASGLLGPMDGTGTQAQLVDDMASRGILWINASGNSATEHYRFTFNDKQGNRKHTFPDGSQVLLYKPPTEDARIILNWDDWGGDASQDYDLYLYDESGQAIAASEDTQREQPKDIPVEVIRLDKPARKSYYIAIVARHITRPAVFDLYAHNGKLGYSTADHSLGTPADARGALTVGAIAWRDNKLEPFSSQGPTNDGRLKPELVAPDRVTTRSYRGEIFPGTSASTPHVAGAAALAMSRYPQLKAAEVTAWLISHAVDMGPAGPDTAYGHGRLQLPAPGQAQTPMPAQSRTPVIVTAQPTAQQAPATREPDRKGGSAIGLLACLGGLMCAGAIGSLGGLALLILVARRRPALARPAPPGPMPPQSFHPPAPAAPVPAPVLANPNGATIPIRLGKLSLGRSPENDIHLDDSQISRRQAELGWDGSHLTVADLGSRNGTFVNGRRLMPHVPEALRPGDQISFGASIWTVLWNP